MTQREGLRNRPKCPVCDSGSVVVRKDKSILCRRCGHDSRSVKNG